MRKMKDSGIPWIGEIPISWTVRRLKNVATVQTGSTPSKTMQTSYYSDTSGLPWIKPENLGINTPISETAEYLTHEGKVSARLFPPNTVYVCCIGSIGKTGYSFTEASCNQQVNAIVFLNMFWKYGYYVTIAQESEYLSNASGNVVKILNSETQKNIVFPYPSLKEQRNIANFLDAECARIDAIIEQTRATVEEYKKLKQSIITQAVTKGIRPNRPMKDSGIEWIGEIPMSYTIERIKHLGSYRNGLTYTPDDLVDEGLGVLVLRSSNILHGKLYFEDNVYVNTQIPERLFVRKGDIVICSRNGSRELIGKCAIVEEDLIATFGAFMMIFRCKSPKYMYYILNSDVFKFYLSTFLTSTINQLTSGNFGNMAIVWCSDIQEQNEIVSFLDKEISGIDRLIKQKDLFINELESYKKSLIYEYVTGKKEAPL